MEGEIRTLTAQCERKHLQLELVTKLIASSESQTEPVGGLAGTVGDLTGTVGDLARTDSDDSSTTNGNGSPTTAAEVKVYVEQILADAKRPMKIGEIHAEFIRRGFPIPGKGTPFNILVHISREMKSNKNAKFVWAARGTYALRRYAANPKKKNPRTRQEGR